MQIDTIQQETGLPCARPILKAMDVGGADPPVELNESVRIAPAQICAQDLPDRIIQHQALGTGFHKGKPL
jgi:hypothetical protein